MDGRGECKGFCFSQREGLVQHGPVRDIHVPSNLSFGVWCKRTYSEQEEACYLSLVRLTSMVRLCRVPECISIREPPHECRHPLSCMYTPQYCVHSVCCHIALHFILKTAFIAVQKEQQPHNSSRRQRYGSKMTGWRFTEKGADKTKSLWTLLHI